MPTYNWFCKVCEQNTEVTRSMADIDQQPDGACCDVPDRVRTPSYTTKAFGNKWTRDMWKSQTRGNKGSWGK